MSEFKDFFNFIFKQGKYIEFVFVAFFALSLVGKIPFSETGDLVMTVSLLSLVVFYLLYAESVRSNPEISIYDRFWFPISMGFIALAIVGILFKFRHWPKANTLLFGGVALLVAVLPALVYRAVKDPDIRDLYYRHFGRIIVVGGIALGMYFKSAAAIEAIFIH